MTTITFLPEQGSVNEAWTWETDVLTTWNGSETRLSLAPTPRVEQRGSFRAVTPGERRETWLRFAEDLDSPDVVPLWAWGSRVNASASSGTATVTFDTARAQVAVGDHLILVKVGTGESQAHLINAVTATTVTLATNLTADIDADWTAYKGMLALIKNSNSLGFAQTDGTLSLRMDSWEEPVVQAENTAASLTTFNSLPVLERLTLAPATEEHEFPRTVLDFGLGGRSIGTRNTNVLVTLKRRFLVDRATDPADVDYWRLFLDTVKGSWKAFLMSTQLEDMTLASGLSQGGTTMTVSEGVYDLYHAFDAYKNFEIVYSDGTSSYHTITNSASNGVVTFTPALPSDPKVSSVDRISYLLKCRMADRLQWRHRALKSELAFDVTTTNDG